MNLINISSILPNVTRSGFKIQKRIVGNRIMLKYKTQGRIVEQIFPNKIFLDNSFFVGFGLSLGDGLNNPSIKNTHYNFANSSFELVKVIVDWLKAYFGIQTNKIQFFIQTKDNSNYIRHSIKKTEKLFNLNSNVIKIYFSERNFKDVLTIQTSNTFFQLIYLRLFDHLEHVIISNSDFRRAFLKGLFAAEGHIKHSVYNTIESVSYSFNPRNEKYLAFFVRKCLDKEGINAKITDSLVYFCGYENMLKFYLIGAMDLHKYKKEKFIELCKNATIVLHFKEGFLNQLANKISQRKLAKYLNCSQSAISKSYEKSYFPLVNLIKIYNYVDINYDDITCNVDYITIRTSIVKNKDSVNFMISNKLYALSRTTKNC